MNPKYFIKTTLFLLLSSALIIACKKDDSANSVPSAASLKISPDSGAGGNLVTITGSDLAGVQQIILDNDSVPVSFNPVFNTNNALLFRVPDTANGGDQNIILVKKNGASVKIPFKVIALVTISGVSNYDFVPGDEITLTGNNLGDVSNVVLAGTNDAATVVSASKKQLVIKMPATSANRAKLTITNSSGTITTTQELVNINNTYQLFTDDYENGVQNGSWGPATTSTDAANVKTGTASFAATYQKGNWSADGFANWGTGIPDLTKQGYTYLTFWVKGGLEDYTLYLTASTKAGGSYGNSDQSTPINVKAGIWNYFKLSLSDIKLWSTGSSCAQIGWWIQGPNDQDETFYFDDVMFVK
ncbi:MAG: IPT/TIG domain-containing protein [Arachidicoccus sp.]|nr:IPT/TIG domain-containing protein [Arachidicoccus sp.]